MTYIVDDNLADTLFRLAEAYPIDIFPEPDPPLADEDEHTVRQAGRAAASLMRHHSAFLRQCGERIKKLEELVHRTYMHMTEERAEMTDAEVGEWLATAVFLGIDGGQEQDNEGQ